MNKFMFKKVHLSLAILTLLSSVLLQLPVAATPFGQGDFGDSTFGSLSSISLSLGSNVNVNLSPNGSIFEGSGSHTVSVTTNDAVGYRLYLLAPTSTNLTLTGGSDTIATTSNSSPATLAANTWGFNTSGSTTDFQRILSTPTEIKTTTEPATSGDNTTVYYGVKTDITKPAGSYVGSVVYTVVARFEGA